MTLPSTLHTFIRSSFTLEGNWILGTIRYVLHYLWVLQQGSNTIQTVTRPDAVERDKFELPISFLGWILLRSYRYRQSLRFKKYQRPQLAIRPIGLPLQLFRTEPTVWKVKIIRIFPFLGSNYIDGLFNSLLMTWKPSNNLNWDIWKSMRCILGHRYFEIQKSLFRQIIVMLFELQEILKDYWQLMKTI